MNPRESFEQWPKRVWVHTQELKKVGASTAWSADVVDDVSTRKHKTEYLSLAESLSREKKAAEAAEKAVWRIIASERAWPHTATDFFIWIDRELARNN